MSLYKVCLSDQIQASSTKVIRFQSIRLLKRRNWVFGWFFLLLLIGGFRTNKLDFNNLQIRKWERTKKRLLADSPSQCSHMRGTTAVLPGISVPVLWLANVTSLLPPSASQSVRLWLIISQSGITPLLPRGKLGSVNRNTVNANTCPVWWRQVMCSLSVSWSFLKWVSPALSNFQSLICKRIHPECLWCEKVLYSDGEWNWTSPAQKQPFYSLSKTLHHGLLLKNVSGVRWPFHGIVFWELLEADIRFHSPPLWSMVHSFKLTLCRVLTI